MAVYCSEECRLSAEQARRHLRRTTGSDTRHCAVCLGPIYGRKKYCSPACSARGKGKNRLPRQKSCVSCGRMILGRGSAAKYCLGCVPAAYRELGRLSMVRQRARRKQEQDLIIYCSCCGTDFSPTPRGSNQRYCSKQCYSHNQTAERLRDSGVKVTSGEIKALFDSNDGTCDACFYPFTDKNRPAVDHCHETLEIRGIIHSGCNVSLGHTQEDPDRLRALARYLEQNF